MKTLTINPGSTSIKYTLFQNQKEIYFSHFKKTRKLYTLDNKKIKKKDFENSFSCLINTLKKENKIKNIHEIKKYGIRIVHGGTLFFEPTKITKRNLKKLEKLSELAPLHNPPAINIIRQILGKNKKTDITGVFDTAFHTTIPEYASTYAIPKKLTKKFSIKKYGFHGIACQSIMHQIKKLNKTIPKKLVICHLGGGASITAIRNGESIDTSMGFTPLEGLMMITRPGDLDNEVPIYLSKKLKKPINEIIEMLNNESGIYGITKIKDMKKVIEKAEKGNKTCQLAVEMFIYRLTKYIFAYYGALQGIDALIFSGGIGENSSYIRKHVCNSLKIIGLKLEQKKNREAIGITKKISAKGSKSIYAVHVEENKEILRQIKK